MGGRHYIEKLLDLLVEMADHCNKKDTPVEGKAKCIDCQLSWNFSIRDHGCLLVNLMDNQDFIDDLTSACEASGVDYRDRLNRVADIFVTNY